MNARNVREAACLFYNKELADLNEREILALDIIRTAPSRFNPWIHQDNLDRAVDAVVNKAELGRKL